MYMTNERNKPINFNIVVGAFIYIVWKAIQVFVGGANVWNLIDLIGSAIAFIVMMYLGAMKPTIFALVKSFLVVIFELIMGRLKLDEAMDRCELLIKEAVALWNSLNLKKKQKNTDIANIPVTVNGDGNIVPKEI